MLTTAEDVTGHEGGGGLGLLKVLIFCVDAYVNIRMIQSVRGAGRDIIK